MTESFAIAPTTGAGLQDWGVLTVEQEIRARALDAAVRAWAPLRGSDPEAYADAISDVALAFEEYIRDGVPEERGSAEERSDDPSKSSDLGEVS